MQKIPSEKEQWPKTGVDVFSHKRLHCLPPHADMMGRSTAILGLLALICASHETKAQLRLFLDNPPNVTGVDEASDGSIALVGWFDTAVDLGSEDDPYPLDPIGGKDGFLAAYTADGMLRFALPFRGITAADEVVVKGMSRGLDGSYWIVGELEGDADFDPSGGEYLLSSSTGTSSAFIAHYNLNGALVSAYSYASESTRSALYNVVVTQDGDVLATGEANGSVDVQPGSGELYFHPAEFRPYFLVAYSSFGTAEFVYQLGSDQYNGYPSTRLAADPTGGAIVKYGDWPCTDPPCEDPRSYFARIDSDGTFDDLFWLSSALGVTDIAVDSASRIRLTGYIWSTIDFDPGPEQFLIDTEFPTDALLVAYDDSNNPIFGFSFGGEDEILVTTDTGRRIQYDADGSSYLLSTIHGEADIDPGPGELIVGIPGAQNDYPSSTTIAKYTLAGELAYGFSLGTIDNYVFSHSLRVNDGQGYFTFFGVLDGFANEVATVDIDPGPGVFEISAEYAFFAASYSNADGSFPITTRNSPARYDPETTSLRPNPFSETTTFSFTPSESGNVRIDLFDLLGRRIRTLLDTQVSRGTRINVSINEAELPSGVYAIRVMNPSGAYSRLLTKSH